MLLQVGWPALRLDRDYRRVSWIVSSGNAAWQPQDHYGAEHGQTNAEPQKAPLSPFASAVGQHWQGHAAIATLGLAGGIVLLAIQAFRHGDRSLFA
jgi:hypothetical protein